MNNDYILVETIEGVLVRVKHKSIDAIEATDNGSMIILSCGKTYSVKENPLYIIEMINLAENTVTIDDKVVPETIELDDETKTYIDSMTDHDLLKYIHLLCYDWDFRDSRDDLGKLLNEIDSYLLYHLKKGPHTKKDEVIE